MIRTLVGWSRRHLFSSWANSFLTLLSVWLLYKILPGFFAWGIFDANWVGDSVYACTKPGACWPFVIERIDQFLYGFYPEESQYRVQCAGVLFVCLVLFNLIRPIPLRVKALVSSVSVLVLLVLLIGGYFGLSVVPTDLWGGLFLTVFLSFGSIICSFPIALLLALGRKSSLPVVKTLCVTYIELIRGVPLISVLYMASVMLPMFLPEGMDLNKLLRAFLGITLFQAAYLAEVIRGGLNSLPKGQYEAGQALGLSYWPLTILIILPQALKTMIPGIVNTFIALFKDTTLVMIIGLFDFLGIVQAATTDAKWLGTALEGYVFCAIVYWIFCYSMARYSQYLEKKLGRT